MATDQQQLHAQVVRENDSAILDRLMGMLQDLPRREREAVIAGASFKSEADDLRECGLRVVTAYDAMLAASLEKAVEELRALCGPDVCASCGHPRDRHSSGGMCAGTVDGDECYCVRFPDAPDFTTAGPKVIGPSEQTPITGSEAPRGE